MARRPTSRKDVDMVFLKFKRPDNCWQWRFDLTEVIAIGYKENFDEMDHDVSVGEHLNDGDGRPYVLIATINDRDTRAFYFHPTEAYLCDQRSGSTVEILL